MIGKELLYYGLKYITVFHSHDSQTGGSKLQQLGVAKNIP